MILKRFQALEHHRSYRELKEKAKAALSKAGADNVLLYGAAPERLRRVMAEQQALSRLLEFGEAVVRVDYGPHHAFASPEDIYAECLELNRVWHDNVFVVQHEKTSHCLRLRLTHAQQ